MNRAFSRTMPAARRLLEAAHREKEAHGALLLRMRHQSIADAIARYVRRHPAAADTDVGIAEWWLLDMEERVSIDEVREALEVLASRGVMEMVTLQDGRTLWRPTRRRSGA